MKLQYRIINRFVPVLILSIYIGNISAQSVHTSPPTKFGVIGSDKPADFYVTDIATDNGGNIYTVDPLNSWVKKYAPDGSEQLRINIGRSGWPRQISVDPSGQIYVARYLTPDAAIRVYSNAGSLIAVWTLPGSPWGDVFAETDDRILTTTFRSGTEEVVVFDRIGDEIFRFGGGQLAKPFGVATAPDGSIYVTELAVHGVRKFDADGNSLFTLGGEGAGKAPGEFNSPRSVAVDSFGNVYVLDRRNERVQKFASNGQFLLEWGERGAEPGQFIEPDGITVAPDDTVWVAGYHGHDIQHFDGNGVLLDRWKGESGPGDLGQARGVVVSDTQLFVVDGWNQSIEVFDSSTGEFLYDFGERDQGAGFNFPRAIDIGPNGDLYITDDGQVMQTKVDGTVVASFPDNTFPGYRSKGIVVSQDALFETSPLHNQVYKKDGSDGEILEQWGGAGSGPGEFAKPHGIALAPDGTLYVADTNNTRIQRFTEDGAYIGEWATAAPPTGIALDPLREILYVGEKNAVEAYDLNGGFLFSWGERGNGPGQLKSTYGISLTPDGNIVYVSDKNNNRVQRFVFPDAFVGRPTHRPGADLGLFVWRHPNREGTWHVRISGDGPGRLYNLEVNSSEDFISVEGFKLGSNDRLSVQGSDLQLTGKISTWQDGLDLVVLDEATLSFKITINGESENLNIGVGETGVNPGTNIFQVR